MYHYVYKITNNVNGKFYIGIHSTNNLQDGYTGSGTLLKIAIKKYGISNFTKEILESFNTRKEAFDHERSLVTKDLVKERSCYNLCEGGVGPLSSEPVQIRKFHSETTQYVAVSRKTVDFLSFQRKKRLSRFEVAVINVLNEQFPRYLSEVSLALNRKEEHDSALIDLHKMFKSFPGLSDHVVINIKPWDISEKTAYAKSRKYSEA